ncbi:MAG TPA: 16S rRNA (guanine(527)-N(7))-methyltransferase RsmG [Propionibacteriaceae bacterium]|nr:16S rRNA (guanine(527)-N(7))-methyltransferase RsmG [Propionibacteriaceae bacterium]
MAEAIERYVDILASRGIEWGLLGPREAPRLFDRHILNSVALAELIPQGSRVVDVGSGAGLPGIPLAVVRPDLDVTLLEPLLRRYTFLEEAVAELGLEERVAVVRGRAEETKERFDVVVARAVAPLARLLGWTSGLFLPHGELLALKGSSAADEVAAARRDLVRLGVAAEVLRVRADQRADPTTVVRVRRG